MSQAFAEIARHMDAEYTRLAQARPRSTKDKSNKGRDTYEANVLIGNLQELAWWAAYLRSCAKAGCVLPIAGREQRA